MKKLLYVFSQEDHWLFSMRCLVVLMVIFGALLAYAAYLNPFIGHADQAACAILAKNLCEGHGYYTTYLFQFFKPYEIRHPDNVWPLLHPTVIALFFKIGGYTATMARLPNVIYILLMTLFTYIFAMKLIPDRRVAFVSAIVVLTGQRYNTGLLNNTGAVLFFLLFIMLVFMHESKSRWVWLIPAAFFAALAALQRVEYIFFFPIYVFVKFLNYLLVSRSFLAAVKKTSMYVLFLLLVVVFMSPYFIRNIYSFGEILPDNAGFLALLAKYDNFSHEAQFGVYYGHNFTAPSILFSKGAYHFVKTIFRSGAYVATYLSSGLGRIILTTFFLIGIFWGSKIFKRYKFFHLYVLSTILFYAFFYSVIFSFEDRYLWYIYPYMAIFGVAVIFEGLEGAKKTSFGNYFLRVAPVIILMLHCIYYSSSVIWTNFRPLSPTHREIIATSDWISKNSPPGTVFMSRQPWEASWHSGRDAVMVPYDTTRRILEIMKAYKVDYLVLDIGDCPRPDLLNSIKTGALKGIEPVYKVGSTQIYKIDRNNLNFID